MMERPVEDARNYYEVLGISRDAPDEEIKQRYKALVLKFHPDRERSSIARDAMVSINNAYEVLSDPQKRRAYDASLSRPPKQAQERPHARPRVLPVTTIGRRCLALIVTALLVSFLAGYKVQILSGNDSQVSEQFVVANSHYFAAIVHEALVTLPLFIPGLGLAWGVLGSFTSALAVKALLVTTISAKGSGLFLTGIVGATALKLAAYYTGMCRSLTLLASIRRRKFTKLDNIFTQADMILSAILAAVAGLVEHTIVNIR